MLLWLSIVDTAVKRCLLSSPVAAVKAANLVDTLSSWPLPSSSHQLDDVRQTASGTQIALFKDDILKLTKIPTYHVVSGKVCR